MYMLVIKGMHQFIAASISTTFTFATTSVAATTTTELNQDSWEWPKHRM
jgi:hypothetical protein